MISPVSDTESEPTSLFFLKSVPDRIPEFAFLNFSRTCFFSFSVNEVGLLTVTVSPLTGLFRSLNPFILKVRSAVALCLLVSSTVYEIL